MYWIRCRNSLGHNLRCINGQSLDCLDVTIEGNGYAVRRHLCFQGKEKCQETQAKG